MHVALDERFETERKQFRLVCSCEQCAYFAPDGSGRCAHGYPNDAHRQQAFEPPSHGAPPGGTFCKEFELA